jgi:hypothetical protein
MNQDQAMQFTRAPTHDAPVHGHLAGASNDLATH